MKKLFFLFAFIGMFSAVNAQSCTHAAKAAKNAKTSVVSADNAVVKAASKAAANDESIEARVCSKSGTTSYYKKNVGTGGEVSFDKVSYDMDAKAFQMVAAAPAKGCAGKSAKSCTKAEKAACAKGAAGKACCSKDGATAKGKACCSSKKGAAAKTCTKAEKAACAKSGKKCSKGAKEATPAE